MSKALVLSSCVFPSQSFSITIFTFSKLPNFPSRGQLTTCSRWRESWTSLTEYLAVNFIFFLEISHHNNFFSFSFSCLSFNEVFWRSPVNPVAVWGEWVTNGTMWSIFQFRLFALPLFFPAVKLQLFLRCPIPKSHLLFLFSFRFQLYAEFNFFFFLFFEFRYARQLLITSNEILRDFFSQIFLFFHIN